MFLLYFRKDTVHEQLAASFDFAVTSRWMIIYTGNYTFPIAIMSVFRTKLYMQYLHSIFWFLTSYKSVGCQQGLIQPVFDIGIPILGTLNGRAQI